MQDPSAQISTAEAAIAALSAAPLIGARIFKERIKDSLGDPPGSVRIGREVETRGGPRSATKRSLKRRDFRQMGLLERARLDARLALFARTVAVELAELMTHVQAVGPTNQGKTQAMLLIAEQLLAQGLGVLVHETGGDLSEKLVPIARAHGRAVFVLDPTNDLAQKLNIIEGNPQDAAERASSTMEAVGSDEQFFKTHNSNMIRSVVLAAHAHAAAHGGVATLKLALKIANDHKTRVDALGLKWRGTDGKTRAAPGPSETGRWTVNSPHLDAAARGFWEDEYYGSWTDQQRNIFAQGMKGAILALLDNPLVARAVCPEPGEANIFSLREAVESGGLVVLRSVPGAGRDGTVLGVPTARTLSVWLLQFIQQVVLQRKKDRSYPLICFFDEAHNSLGRDQEGAASDFVHWISQARHHGAGCIFGYQSFRMLPEPLQEAFTTNLRNKLVCGGLSPKDAEDVQKLLGDDIATVRKVRTESEDSERNTTRVEQEERDRWSIDEIRHLPWGYWLYSGFSKGQLLYPTLVKMPLTPTAEEVGERVAARSGPGRPPRVPPSEGPARSRTARS